MKNLYPHPLTIAVIFIASFFLFLTVPKLILQIAIVQDFFAVLGENNALFHSSILEIAGIQSFTSKNLLYIASGAVVEYSPYCYGFLTILAFSILTLMVSFVSLRNRIKWIIIGSVLLIAVNQLRIFIELLFASKWPSSISNVDILFYPLMPIAGFYLWYQLLNNGGYVLLGGVEHSG